MGERFGLVSPCSSCTSWERWSQGPAGCGEHWLLVSACPLSAGSPAGAADLY